MSEDDFQIIRPDKQTESVFKMNTVIKHQFLVKYLLAIVGLFGGVILALSILLVNLFPLKRNIPYLIIQDGKTQQIVELTPSLIKKSTLNALVEGYLREYITQYMQIDFNLFFTKKRLDVIKAFSSDAVLSAFANLSNPKTNLELAKYEKEGIVKEAYVKSITKIEKGRNADSWSLVVETRDYALGDPNNKKVRLFNVTMMTEVNNGKVNIMDEKAKINPLGIVITQIYIKDYYNDEN